MSSSDNQPDIKRRRVVQGAALSGAAMAMPVLASAVCGPKGHQLAETKSMQPASMLTSDDIAIELVETETTVRSGKLARVSITNTSHRPLKLSHVSPGAISTQKGVYQLNARLTDNPLSIRPGGVYQFWLSPDDGTQALRSGKPKMIDGEVAKAMPLEVSVITKLESGRWTGTQRVQALIS